VKQLTGGDPVKARLMRQDFFQFDPQFKIFLAANHKPVIRGTDFAIWRRIKLIPFTVTIPEDDQDKALGDKLLAELPGVLAWAVRGCLDWQAGGLREPAAVSAATAAYRAESDLLGAFLAECCEEDDPKAEVQAGPLYKAYVDWAEKNGEKPVTGTMFGRRMTERGIDKYKDRKHRVNYIGIRLAPAQPTP
jgi:putative DNA primase/helicase